VRRDGRQTVLVFGAGAEAAGLAIDSIVDIAQSELKMQKASRTPGVVGSGIVAGHAVDIVDPEYFINQIVDTVGDDVSVGVAA
jgi:two-component system chemotaxis sensor kinase CheA